MTSSRMRFCCVLCGLHKEPPVIMTVLLSGCEVDNVAPPRTRALRIIHPNSVCNHADTTGVFGVYRTYGCRKINMGLPDGGKADSMSTYECHRSIGATFLKSLS